MQKSLYFLIVFLLLFPRFLQAQQYNFRSYSIEQGLPQSEVFAMLEDRRGCLWAGTNGGGLSRFDGRGFTTFDNRHGLASNLVRALFEDSKGNIWVGTVAGISKYDGKKFENFALAQGVQAALGFRMGEDNLGRLWVMAFLPNGSELYMYDGKRMIDQGKLPELKGQKPLQLFDDGKNNLFMTMPGELLVSRDGKFVPSEVNELPELKGKNVVARLNDSKGNFWLSVFPDNKLFKYNGSTLSEVVLPEVFSKQFVNQVFEDRKGNFWLRLNSLGMLKYDGQKFTHFSIANGLVSNEVNSILQDREGNMWFGIGGGGITRLDSERFTHFTPADGLANPIVWTIYEDSKHRIWMGATGGGISCYDGRKLTTYNDKQTAELGRIRAFFEEDDGSMLIGSYEGKVLRLKNNQLTAIEDQIGLPRVQGFPRVMKIARFRNGQLWFITFAGIFIYENDKLKPLTITEGLTNNTVRDAVEDTQGRVWLSTNGALDMYDGHKITNFPHPTNPASNNVLQALIDRKGQVWMATYGGGICRFDGKNFINLGEKDGLGSSHIYSIVFDDDGNLWAGTQKGVDKVTLDENCNVKAIKSYRKDDGFIGEETNGNAAFKDHEGNLWFGTLRGATRYNAREDRPNTLAPQTYITGVRLFFKEVSWNDSLYADFHEGVKPWFPLPDRLVLPYDQNHLTFDFTAYSYRAPEKVRYQWKLEGVDKDWSPVSSKTEASYPNLPAGRYTFKVRACNDDGLWNEQPVTYVVEVLPPYWQSWWFRTSVLGLVFGLVVTGVRVRIRNIEERRKELEVLVRERTAEVIHQKNELLQQAQHLQLANREIQKKNDDITASITYARRIQTAMLPLGDRISRALPEHFILFKPRDIVSGDFYWCSEIKLPDETTRVVIAAVDCTGHGVPGAFMSMIGNDLLNEIVNIRHIVEPDEILREMHSGVRLALKQDHTENRDGMDVAVCVIDRQRQVMEFAGAKNPLIYIQPDEYGVPQLHNIKGAIQAVGGHQVDRDCLFMTHHIDISRPTTFYIFSDGYQDQFSHQGRKFMVRRFRELLFKIHAEPMEEQRQLLEHTLREWMGKECRQIDDILVIGVRLS